MVVGAVFLGVAVLVGDWAAGGAPAPSGGSVSPALLVDTAGESVRFFG